MPDPRGLSGPPDPFYDTFVLPLAGRAVLAAVGLGVFDSLAAEPSGAAVLAERLRLDPTGMAALCEALVSLGYLRVEGDRLQVVETVAPLVTRDSDSSIATF
ncbi:MAG TPA: methyltransferase dimerization domain-containing protein, partial [Solirubrobacteraceae bacterium]|nr:methyltransferase dimerization domain-containing protein [Solirubrobacteraceae bacterium]